MNDLEMLNKEFQQISSKQIKLETIIEQAVQQCKEIEEKYNIKSEEELKALLDKAQQEYFNQVEKVTIYLADAKQALMPYEGLL
jgi:DNA-binding IscR family transcriptional regulator